MYTKLEVFFLRKENGEKDHPPPCVGGFEALPLPIPVKSINTYVKASKFMCKRRGRS